MLRSKIYVRKTRRGKVQKVLREHYLRNDIWCGAPSCKVCDTSSAILGSLDTHNNRKSCADYIVLDTNVVLHQMDLLESPEMDDVIVPAIVRDEVKHQNLSIYNRLRALCEDNTRRFFVFSNEFHEETYVERLPGESPNDRNDRAVRAVASWYKKHLPHVSFVLLTNDKLNASKAREEGLEAQTALAFTQSRSDAPQLLDLVARGAAEVEDEEANEEGQAKKKRKVAIYQDHLSPRELEAGVRAGRLHQGTLRVSRYNPSKEAWVPSESVGRNILIRDYVAMNRSVDGDRVVVELLPESEWGHEGGRLQERRSDEVEGEEEEEDEGVGLGPVDGEVGRGMGTDSAAKGPRCPTGRVVGIIKRAWRPYSGSLDPASVRGGRGPTSRCLFVAHDRRIPRVRVATRQLDSLLSHRIVVVIDSWSVNSRWPDGHYVRTLGNAGEKETETEMLLVENDIQSAPFTEAVYACLPALPWDSAAAEVGRQGRLDLRDHTIFSVDPPGCRDIDDALHVKQLDNGNFEVGVHIADVTHFVLPGSAVDEEAADRCTSVYLVDRRIDMLPKALTEDICSLRSDVERLAFSVLWEMDPDANIVSTRFTKSIIKSCAAMTYQEAQSRMDDTRLSDPVSVAARHMCQLAMKLRARRMERGALTLASPEVKFNIDTETHDPKDVGVYQIRESNQMVEEMMLLANISVAEKIFSHYPSWALLRRHQTPSPEMFEPVLRSAAVVGVSLDVSTSSALAASLDQATLPQDPYFNTMIRILTTRCMTQAQYFCSGEYTYPEFQHYGLASPIYTHFTSPIRRYADVVVHRLLAAALGISRLPHNLTDKVQLRAVADQINYRHRNAQMASRASAELYTLIFFHNRTAVTDARVIKVKENAMIVFVPKYGIEGIIWLARKDEKGLFQLDAATQTVVAVDGTKSYTIFDQVWVKISVEEEPPQGRKLVLVLVDKPEDDADGSK